jgi:hypothetical protein
MLAEARAFPEKVQKVLRAGDLPPIGRRCRWIFQDFYG